MRPLLQHAQRSLFANAGPGAPKCPSRSFSHAVKSAPPTPSRWLQCQCRVSVAARTSRITQSSSFESRRSLHQPSDDGKPKPDNETPEERLARVRADIALRERQEQERLEKERVERERQEKARLEKERQERERQERERQERERLEREAQDRQRQTPAQEKPLPEVIELGTSNTITRSAPAREAADAAEAFSRPSKFAPPSANEVSCKTDIHSNGPIEHAVKDNIERVAADQLPSHHQAQRWDLSKRFQDLMDDILPKLAVVTHKVNTYTGTDYSGIEALKREIKDQGRAGPCKGLD